MNGDNEKADLPPEDRPSEKYGPFEEELKQLNAEEESMDIAREFREGMPGITPEVKERIDERMRNEMDKDSEKSDEPGEPEE